MVKVLKEKRRVSFLFTVQMSLGTVFRLVFTRKTGPWIAFALRRGENGITVEEELPQLGVPKTTFYRWSSTTPPKPDRSLGGAAVCGRALSRPALRYPSRPGGAIASPGLSFARLPVVAPPRIRGRSWGSAAPPRGRCHARRYDTRLPMDVIGHAQREQRRTLSALQDVLGPIGSDLPQHFHVPEQPKFLLHVSQERSGLQIRILLED